MAEQTIMLNCAAGMSTSLLVNKMKEAAQAQGIDAKIFACPASEADQHFKEVDCILLGPQVSYLKSDMENKTKGAGKDGQDIPLGVIDMQAYGMMDGAKALKQAEDLIKG